MRMQEFTEGKVAVYAATREESERFLEACENTGLLTRGGDRPHTLLSEDEDEDEDEVGPDTEYAYAYGWSWGRPGISHAAGPEEGPNRGYHNRNRNEGDPPFASITVKEFFKEEENQ